ncbi:MAG: hypothetical protein COZ80_02990 [Ignavibacteria bacterium CG_4_8_14_3_um_filter_37_9]|nr:MAG: hypothetical protein COZ80_02990 [Ignavibacteria bacterium CG_4_8_14_3_um_filter_37_9]
MNISFQINGFILAGVAILLTGYAMFVYMNTIPNISKKKKIVLVVLRILALILLFAMIFEPLLKIEKEKINQPVHFFFVDNSKSLKQFEDKSPFISEQFLTEVKKLPSSSFKLFTFGSTVSQELPVDSADFSFTKPSTNFSKIFSSLQKEETLASITIVSDGIITEGTSPQYQAEKLNVPIFTIGVGDSTTKKDISIQNILHNEFLYTGTNTPFLISVAHHGFSGAKSTLSLFEDNSFLQAKEISFTESELQNIEFLYKPKSPGEKKISFVLAPLKNEYSIENNRQSIFVKVLANKLSVVLLAGAPSADITFIKNSLQADTNNFVRSFTQITPTQYLEKILPDKALDDADVLYLVNFPSSQTANGLVNKVAQLIKEKNLPYFFLLTSSVDHAKLRIMQNELPFSFSKTDKSVVEAQPVITDEFLRNPIIQFSGKNVLEQWNNLPPVYKPNWELFAKPGSEVLAKTRINNIALNSPLIISNRLGGKRAIALFASDIWKWKLQKASTQLDLFDRFLSNGLKWLHAVEQKKPVTISTNKKFYSTGEKIYVTAEVYDEAFNALNDADIKGSVKSKDTEVPISFSNIGNGLYEGDLTAPGKGDYILSGEAFLDHKSLGTDNERFSIGDLDYELQNTKMNSDLLKLLAKETKGKFFYNSTGNLINILKEISKNTGKSKIEVKEYRLWSSDLLLALIIFLFAAEWFIRKREGLL